MKTNQQIKKEINTKFNLMKKAQERQDKLLENWEKAEKLPNWNKEKDNKFLKRFEVAEQNLHIAYADYYKAVHSNYSQEQIEKIMFGKKKDKLLRGFTSDEFIKRLGK